MGLADPEMPRSPAPDDGRPPADPRAVGRWLRQQLRGAEDTGYFGPHSAMWHLHQEAVLGVGLGRALLLQVAHPWVAQAVAEHSAFRERPLDRLLSTVTAAEMLVFGSRRQAEATAARLCRVHARIAGTLREDVGAWPAGTPYRADDPDALLWVLVTLVDTALCVYEGCLGALPESTVRAYLGEAARLGALLGIPARRERDSRTRETAHSDPHPAGPSSCSRSGR